MAEYTKLGDLGEIFIGLTYKPENVSTEGTIVLRSSNIQDGELDFNDIVRVNCPVRENLLVKQNDILMCSRNGSAKLVGKCTLLPRMFEPMTFGAFMTIIRTPYNGYLRYFFDSSAFRNQIKGSATTTINQITRKMLDDVQVPIFDIETQNQISAQFEKLSMLITLRKEQLAKLDQLVKSRFIELFGDRYTNDKKWDNKPLYECADFYNGKAHEQVVDENGEYILVTSRCIASDISDYRRTNALLFPLQVNDIAMVMSDVPNGRALAKCILIDEDGKYTLNQRICCLRNYSFNSVFFYHLLNRHEYFLSFNDGNAQTNLRKDDLLACNIIIPPLELQEQFAAFVEQTDKSKLAIQQSLDKLETLKKSLMQEYFG